LAAGASLFDDGWDIQSHVIEERKPIKNVRVFFYKV